MTSSLIRTRSPIPLVASMMFAPHLPYSVTLPDSHDADGGSRETKDDIGNCLGGVGRG